ncbi:lysophospholipid acyltransferase family protein [Kistimonas asteriae]|uniref:lysophospholipid acyltransferase family protein n=1 Tax=Kistimonas asteriae TaxID=517724 RepID=UPI001BABC82F|nr:lysophospholipid acyltransferase family protein [Kistimonas asteriae]
MKTLLVYLAMGIARLIAWMPLSVAHALGTGFGYLNWRLNNRRTKISRTNIQLCYPQLSDNDRESLVKQSMIESGKTVFEAGMTWFCPLEKVDHLITRVTGMEHLQKALDDDKGIILILPHHGTWEILNHFLRHHLYMYAMYKPAKIKVLDRWIYRSRSRVKVGLIPANVSGVKTLHRVLREKAVVAVLPDQEPGPKSGVFAPFFGEQAWTGKLVNNLASTHPAALLSMYARRSDNGGYEVIIKPAPETIRDKDPVIAATAMNASIEECINECPAMYQWNYARFKTRPEGKEKLYRFKRKHRKAQKAQARIAT